MGPPLGPLLGPPLEPLMDHFLRCSLSLLLPKVPRLNGTESYIVMYVYVIYIYILVYFTRLRLIARLLGFLCVLPSFPMPPLTYCKVAGPIMLCHNLEARNYANNLKTETPAHKITHALMQI